MEAILRGSLLFRVAIVVVLLGILFGCGGSEEASNRNSVANSGSDDGNTPSKEASPNELKGEVTIWTWDLEHPTVLKEFNTQYPDIKINIVNVPNGDMLQKIQTTIASGGELPEMIRIDRSHLPRYYEMNVLEPLEHAPYNADKSLIIEHTIESHLNKDGLLAAVPEDISVAGLAYKKSLAMQYFGTDDPDELESMFPTWEDFIDKGKEVLAQSNGKVKMFTSLGDVRNFIEGQRSAPYFDGDQLKTDVLEDVLSKLVKFRDSGIVDKIDQWTPAWNASFATDDHIFAMCPVWMPQYVIGPNDKDGGPRWGLMVPPGGGVTIGGSAHGILKDSKNKELAWKFIEFIQLTQEGAEALKADGIFSHYAPAYDDMNFANWQWPNFGEQNIGEKLFIDVSQSTRSIPVNINDMLLSEATGIVIQALVRDDTITVDKAMDIIRDELKAKKSEITF